MTAPLAIVGMGCRLPGGVDSPDALWTLLVDEMDAVGPVPADRWHAPSWAEREPRLRAGRGGFLRDIDRFDAGFFGFSPREAARMDPQQRLALEVSWEALEDAGIDPRALAGTATGVFVGCSGSDWLAMQLGAANRAGVDIHTQTGGNPSIVANRLSWIYDLAGPSLAVDTACSSALTALHLAARALEAGECDLALVGGVQVLLRPEPTLAFGRAGMLSPEGRCKAFAADADGYVRSEGCGFVVLQRRDDAEALGRRAHALVLGTGVNQDGQTTGLTVPSAAAQTRLVRAVLGQAGVDPREVQVAEAHGTGTPVGDPLEAEALGAALGAVRGRSAPLLVGSAKSNLGHLEPAAGIVGLIKLALSLRHRRVPRSLHCDVPNPEIPFEALGLEVATSTRPWPPCPPGEARGVVNAFGFGGANAHALLGEAPPMAAPPRAADDADVVLVPLSAHGPEALADLARRWHQRLEQAPDRLADLASSASLGRAAHPHRAALICSDRGALSSALDALAGDEAHPALLRGEARLGRDTQPVFTFAGMGPQFARMGLDLMEREPAFARMVRRCDALFFAETGMSILEELGRDAESTRLQRTAEAQPAIFAVQAGLVALWASWGVTPAAVIGHSAGEVAAFWAAGVLSLAEAIRVLASRSALQQETAGETGMLAVGLPVEALSAQIDGREDLVVAAVNSPRSTTLAGTREAVSDLGEALQAQGVFARVLRGNVAYHSPWMEPIRAQVIARLGAPMRRPAQRPLYSTVLGGRLHTRRMPTDYWWRNIRQSVRFQQAVEALADDGYRCFLEVGPHPVLQVAIRETLQARGVEGWTLASMRRDAPARRTLLRSLGALWAAGIPCDWAQVQRGRLVPLPTYPWQRSRHWNESPRGAHERAAGPEHPLLLRRVDLARPTWERALSEDAPAWLRDHQVQGSVVFPAAGFLEMALAAGGPGPVRLEQVDIERALVVDEAIRTLQLEVEEADGRFTVSSQGADSEAWTLHARGRRWSADGATLAEGCPEPGETELEVSAAYEGFAAMGLEYGPRFRAIRRLWRLDTGVRAELACPEDPGWRLHPAVLDGALQVALVAARLDPHAGTPLPVRVQRLLWLARPAGPTLWCQARMRREGGRELVGEVALYEPGGRPVARLEGLRCRLVPLPARRRPGSELLHTLRWIPDPDQRRPRLDALWPEAVGAAVTAALPALRARLDPSTLQVRAALEPVATACIHAAFRDRLAPGERLDLDQLAARTGALPRLRRWLGWMARVLVEDGVLAPDAGGFAVLRAPDAVDPVGLAERGALRCPAAAVDLGIALRAGLALPEVLRGAVETSSLLFVEGRLDEARDLYRDGGHFRQYNEAAALAVEALWSAPARAKAGRPPRVLELGGGTGGMTERLLEVLPEGAHYRFTDVSERFLQAAARRWGDRPGFTTARLDLEERASSWGPAPGSFDLIVASDVLHVAPDLERTLRDVRGLLAPGGSLLALEVTEADRATELVMGGTPGWWRFEDTALRSHSALLGLGGWRALLARSGFAATEALPVPFPDRAIHSVLLARADEQAPTPEARPFAVVGGDPLAARVVEGLRAAGAEVRAVPDVYALAATAADEVVFVPGPDADATGITTQTLEAVQRAGAVSCRLTLITRQAVALRDEAPRVDQAAAWGLARVAATELPALACRRVDLPDEGLATGLLAAELLDRSGEDEQAWRGGRRHVSRLVEVDASRPHPRPREVPAHTPLRLEAARPGLEHLRLRAFDPPAPGPGQVSLEILAAGVNFKDLMKAMGMLSDSVLGGGFSGWGLGMECAGRVLAVGEGVSAPRVGDVVFGLAPHAMATRVCADARLLAPLPRGWSAAQAAGTPVAFLTAWYGLVHLARLQPGERVLVHAAAGGVGQAALQVAAAAGAEVIATAGTPEKRSLLRSLGAAAVFDSRSTAFAEQVRAQTGGRGVDVVLNALAGEPLRQSLGLLAPFGRFVELGKQDIDGNRALALRAFQDNQAFFAVDVDRLLAARPALVGQMLAELAARADAGALRPLPTTTWPLDQAAEALRFMARARHIGKVVLTAPEGPITLAQPPAPPPPVRADGTYLITGGTRGFGLATAEWLAGQGARHLLLCSRSGLREAAARERVEALRADGVEVRALAVDVCDAGALAAMLAAADQALPPLRGVFHAAMVLDDGYLTGLTPERVARVLAPKVQGALNLHALTLRRPLEWFVLYSSLATSLAHAAQGSYVAANHALEALAARRRSQGLPGLAVCWGAISGTGFVARNEDVARRLHEDGFELTAPEEAFSALQIALRLGVARPGVFAVDWQRWGRQNRRLAELPRYRALTAVGERVEASEAEGGLNLAELSEPARLAAVQRFLARTLRGIVGAEVGVDRSLSEAGVDSLMAVELSNAIAAGLGLEVTVTALLQGPTPAELAERLARDAGGGQ